MAENFAKSIGITSLAKRAIGRSDCGGVRWQDQPLAENVAHIRLIVDTWTEWLGDITGQTGAEIGPGDNLAASYGLLKRGARRMFAVEKYASVRDGTAVMHAMDKAEPTPLTAATLPADALTLAQATMEAFDPGVPLDFICSYDVLEHVDPAPVFRRISAVLRPGGQAVHVGDFTGHGPFYDLARPLDFLTCPDWLWVMMFSAMETTNRVRCAEMMALAEAAGLEVEAHPIRRATPAYLASIRPHLLPRYQRLSDDDLSVMQCMLHMRKSL